MDGVDVPENALNVDDRVRFMRLPEKVGSGNHAANVRNVGMDRVTQEIGKDKLPSTWFAFLDDDDTLTNDYVEKLHAAIEQHPEMDIFIFTMVYIHRLYVLPPPEHEDFLANYVGISFAMRASVFAEGFRFTPSSGEDYDMLYRMREAGKKSKLLHHQTYHVGF
jgi:GT2 family glycosyltransferase